MLFYLMITIYEGCINHKYSCCSFSIIAVAREQIMELYSGNFYKVLIKLTASPYSEVQYNCAGVIGHLAFNGKYFCTSRIITVCAYVLLSAIRYHQYSLPFLLPSSLSLPFSLSLPSSLFLYPTYIPSLIFWLQGISLVPSLFFPPSPHTHSHFSLHAESYHSALLDGNPSAVDFLFQFMMSEEASFVHIALWIIAQFSSGSRLL